MNNNSAVQSVIRTFDILEILCNHGECGITELSKLSELSKATVFRLLNTLVDLDYIKQNKDNSKYFVTTKFLRISALQLSKYDIRTEMHSKLEEISLKCGETVHLVERNQERIVYIDKIENSSTSFRMASFIGFSLPMIYTAGGKAILSHLSNEEIAKVWNLSDIKKMTDKTITDYSLFLKEIDDVRNKGYAIDDEENEVGVCCISKSIPDLFGNYNYSVSVSVPKVRMSDEKLKQIIELLEF